MKKTVVPIKAMEARSVDAIPTGQEWQYEPKWDGFRCLLTRDADAVAMYSKSGPGSRPLLSGSGCCCTVLCAKKASSSTAKLSFPSVVGFSFDDLLQRIHPAASRVKKLGRANSGLVSGVRPVEERQDRACGPAFDQAALATRRLRCPLLFRARTSFVFRRPA